MTLRKPETKEKFFDCECATWEKLNALVADLPVSALTQPGAAGDWSVKDVWAHLAAWMKKSRQVIPLLLKGKDIPANIQQFNEEQYRKNRALKLEVARRRLGRERKQTLAFLQKIPEEQLLEQSRVYSWASFSTFNHYAEHIPALKKFARSTKRQARRK